MTPHWPRAAGGRREPTDRDDVTLGRDSVGSNRRRMPEREDQDRRAVRTQASDDVGRLLAAHDHRTGAIECLAEQSYAEFVESGCIEQLVGRDRRSNRFGLVEFESLGDVPLCPLLTPGFVRKTEVHPDERGLVEPDVTGLRECEFGRCGVVRRAAEDGDQVIEIPRLGIAANRPDGPSRTRRRYRLGGARGVDEDVDAQHAGVGLTTCFQCVDDRLVVTPDPGR